MADSANHMRGRKPRKRAPEEPKGSDLAIAQDAEEPKGSSGAHGSDGAENDDGLTRRSGLAKNALPVSVGLAPDEVIVRGGWLREPTMVGGCINIDGRNFLPLLKGDKRLCNWLTPFRGMDRPLSRTTIVEELQELRNNLIRSGASGTSDDDKRDYARDLLLVKRDARRRTPEEKAQDASGSPKIGEIVLQKEGFPDWTLSVVLDRFIRMAPAIEMTDENVQQLFERVNHDLEAGGHKREAHGSGSPADRKRPKGPADGPREYWLASAKRWVKKELVNKEEEEEDHMEERTGATTEAGSSTAVVAFEAEGPPGGARPHRGSRKAYRTLLRRGTDATPPRRRLRKRRSGSCGSAVPPLDEGSADPFTS